MCGIALIVSGIRIEVSNLIPGFVSPTPQHPQEEFFSLNDIKSALSRRGPNSLGSRKIFIQSGKPSSDGLEKCIMSVMEEHDAVKSNLEGCSLTCDNGVGIEHLAELYFIGATLQLRGTNPIIQPLVDASGNILVYNGEIFGGIHVGSGNNDGDILMQLLEQCCSSVSNQHAGNFGSFEEEKDTIPMLLSRIKGPWSLIYWQSSSKTLWFGRDAFGRRSLLVHWPSVEDSRLLLSSVSPPSSISESSDNGDDKGLNKSGFWEELPCGIYSMSVGDSRMNGYLVGELRKHNWTDPNLEKMIQWDRTHVEPKDEELYVSSKMDTSKQDLSYSTNSIIICSDSSDSGPLAGTIYLQSQKVLNALRKAMIRRTELDAIYQDGSFYCGNEGYAPIAVLFSGGLDSMILAALLNQCLNPKYEIDLLNVSFDGQCAPDRISARAGLKELERVALLRRWKLVEINADLLKLTSETKHVMSLISPANTYMDLNIGVALWLAAGGDGWLYEESDSCKSKKYKSEAKILLVGSGADEQCAGYGRHRTKYRHGSWRALHEEMKLDMQRIWKRNLGRDDRCIADSGKEARFPFLDEDVIQALLDIPLWEIADLDQPSGIGDKKILREVAQLLGLSGAAVLPKRAIQFGSRIARESNRKNFGSNRAANQASAGSVEINGFSNLP